MPSNVIALCGHRKKSERFIRIVAARQPSRAIIRLARGSRAENAGHPAH
jgi:hypothetical protein